MKQKILFCSLLFVVFYNSCFSQNVFYDALVLSKYDKELISEKRKIIEEGVQIPGTTQKLKYKLSKAQINELTIIENFYENPFGSTDKINVKVLDELELAYSQTIKNLLLLSTAQNFTYEMIDASLKKDMKKSKSGEYVIPQEDELSVGNIISNLSGATFQSRLIDATAQIIAEKLQEDLSALFLDSFKKIISENKFLQAFLPRTSNLLVNINPLNNLPSFEVLKNTIIEDLKKTLQNLIDYFSNNSNYSLIKESDQFVLVSKSSLFSKDVLDKIKFGVKIYDKITKGAHPSDVIEFLDANKELLTTNTDFRNTIHFVNVLQLSFRDTNSSKENVAWIDISKLNQLNTIEKKTYFISLLYRNSGELLLKNDELVILQAKDARLNPTIVKNFQQIQENAVKLLTHINNLQSLLSQINKSVNTESFANYEAYLETFNEFLSNFDAFTTETKIPSISALLTEYTGVLKDVLSIYKSVSKGDYGLIFYSSVNLVNKLYPTKEGEIKSIIEPISKYLLFASDLANTNSTSDVKSALSKVISPPGSYTQKRNKGFTFTVSTHPGITFGSEKTGESKWLPTYGLTVPIGFEFNTMTGNGWSMGAFLSMFDIAAVVNYRFGDSESEDLPSEVKFSQVFSPGASFRIGFPNVPLDFGIGYQFTPKLRKLTAEGKNELQNSSRVFISLAYDLTLFGIK